MSWDGSSAVWIATHRISWLNEPSVWLGSFEKLGFIWIVAAAAIAIIRRYSFWRVAGLAVVTAATTFAADSISFAIKDATNRPRPFEVHPEVHPLYVVHSSSFPAGHAATAFAGATLLALVTPRLTVPVFVLAALIGFSRIYDGVHYPTDVLAGAGIGAVTAAGVVVVLRKANLKKRVVARR